MRRIVCLAAVCLVAVLVLASMAMAQGTTAERTVAGVEATSMVGATTGMQGATTGGAAGDLPESGGPAILLPAAVVLLGSGILTYAVLRRSR